MDTIETHEYQGCTINIVPDEDPTNPREDFDHLGTMLYVSTRYLLGDKQVSPDEIKEAEERDDVFCIPVYAYIHGGVVLNTVGFTCPWDSGQCGVIYVERLKMAQEFPSLTESELEVKAEEILRAEVEEFSTYLSGGVVGYQVERNGEHVDSCYGFYSVEDALEEAKGVIND